MAAGHHGSAGASPAEYGHSEFRELADNAPVMIWRSGTDMLCNFFNRPWLEFTGRSMEQELGMGWAQGVHPDDHDRCVDTYVTAFRAREPFSMDYRLRRRDGAYRWIVDNGAPFERDGTFAGYFGSCIDIEERKRLEQEQLRLLDELNHRVKNMLAGVQAIAFQTFRGHAGAEGAYEAFLGRLQAMAAAHDLVTGRQGAGAELAAIVARAARQHGQDSERFRVVGIDPVWIPPKRVQALTLCLNELFTNALRHGALSSDVGAIELGWNSEPERVRLTWKEAGGPPVPARIGRGLGLKLVETLGREGGGEVRFAYPQEGFTCEISFPPTAPGSATA
jgi:two-component system, sensor histidine kinase PdtaS